MGYPTSVQSFTNKNSGDVVQPSHVNDLQTEVSAVETGLLNGLSHAFAANAGFQSSNSTVANLTVNGTLQSSNSTVNALSVSSLSTFAYRPFMPPPDVFRGSLAAGTSSHSNTTRAINWVTDDILTNSSMHSTGTNPERVTPQSTGVYRFNLNAQVVSVEGADVDFALRVEDSSGATIGLAILQSSIVGGNVPPTWGVSGMKRFDSLTGSTQWLRVVARFDNANELSTSTVFEVWKL
jgi:hypothetical protein